MTTTFNPDALDFTPSFSSSLSSFAFEFSPSAAEFLPSFLPPVPTPPEPTPPPKQLDPPPVPDPLLTLASTTATHLSKEMNEGKPSSDNEKKEACKTDEEATRPWKYDREFVMSLRQGCKVLPPDVAIPENYSLLKGKKTSNRGKAGHAEKWTTMPVYTLATSANSFSNYVKNLTSDQEKEIQHLRLLINKITEINYAKLSQQLFESYDYSGYLLEKLSWLIYERATMHHGFSEMYAKLCVDLRSKFIDRGSEETATKFRIFILEKCEKAFYKQEIVEGNELIDAETKRKVRLAGNVKFIGHLFHLKFISPRVVHECFQVQLNEHTISDESIDTFCMLFTSVAPLLRTRTKDPVSEATELREAYERVASLRNDERFSIRVRFMIQTLIDKRSELLTGEGPAVTKAVPSPQTPGKDAPVRSGELLSEIQRVKIPSDIVRELKDILNLQKQRVPVKVLGQKVHALAGKHSLHRPEVVYQICRFALCECVQSELSYFVNLIVKSFVKRKAAQDAVCEGLEIAVGNLKDLRLDCPMANEWLRGVIAGLKERDGLSDGQKDALLAKIEAQTGEDRVEIEAKPAVFDCEEDRKTLKVRSQAVKCGSGREGACGYTGCGDGGRRPGDGSRQQGRCAQLHAQIRFAIREK